jgi:hypothetical protein
MRAPAPRRRLVAALAAAAAVAALVPVGLRWAEPRPHLEPSSSPNARFAEQRPVWAQGSTVRYGRQSLDIGRGFVHAVTPTPYGFFLGVGSRPVDSPGSGYHQEFFDGRTLRSLPGAPGTVHVSPDGRYAAWADGHGPRGPFGRIVQVVVFDVRTGRLVFRTAEGMGNRFDVNIGDQYDESRPFVMGFDATHVYWTDQRQDVWRWGLVSHRVEQVRELESRRSPVTDRQVGASAFLRRGRPTSFDGGYDSFGVLSPDGRYAIESPDEGRLRVTDVRTGRRVALDHPERWMAYAGWHGSSLYALVRSSQPDLAHEIDRSRGRVVSCEMPSGHCSTDARVTRTASVVYPAQVETGG